MIDLRRDPIEAILTSERTCATRSVRPVEHRQPCGPAFAKDRPSQRSIGPLPRELERPVTGTEPGDAEIDHRSPARRRCNDRSDSPRPMTAQRR